MIENVLPIVKTSWSIVCESRRVTLIDLDVTEENKLSGHHTQACGTLWGGSPINNNMHISLKDSGTNWRPLKCEMIFVNIEECICVNYYFYPETFSFAQVSLLGFVYFKWETKLNW